MSRIRADLVLRVIAQLAVPWHVSGELLNREGDFGLAERLGRLHFYFMPRFLAAIDDEIATWHGGRCGYRERPSYILTANSDWDVGHPYQRGWSRVWPHRSDEALFGASRVAKNVLSRETWVPERLESLLRAAAYERARVTLFHI